MVLNHETAYQTTSHYPKRLYTFQHRTKFYLEIIEDFYRTDTQFHLRC